MKEDPDVDNVEERAYLEMTRDKVRGTYIQNFSLNCCEDGKGNEFQVDGTCGLIAVKAHFM